MIIVFEKFKKRIKNFISLENIVKDVLSDPKVESSNQIFPDSSDSPISSVE